MSKGSTRRPATVDPQAVRDAGGRTFAPSPRKRLTLLLPRRPMSDEYLHPPATLADLTPRQMAVAAMIARAKPRKQIAAELDIDCRSVRRHITALVYVLHLDPAGDAEVQIALWWHAQVPVSVTHAA